MNKFDEDKTLKAWKSGDYPDKLHVDKLIDRCIMVIEYRKKRGLDSPKQFFNSIKQLEERLEWLRNYKQLNESPLWKSLNPPKSSSSNNEGDDKG